MDFDLSPALARAQLVINGIVAAVPSVVIGLVVLGLFHLAGRLVKRLVARVTETRLRTHRNAGMAVGRLAQGGVLFLGVLVALAVAVPSFRPGDVIQVLGISSVAIGFAFRDILQNFLAGILLLLTQPFRLGDQIVTGDFEGTVEDIQTRATFIRTYDNRRVVIPNADLFTGKVIVNTAFEKRRLEYDVGIGVSDDVEIARRLILDAIRSVEGVLSDPAPDALVMELAASSVNIRARWWINPPRRSDVLDARDRVLAAIKDTLLAHGIDLPYPTQQILFHDQTEETDGDRTRQREGWPAGKGDAPRPARLSGALHALAERADDHPLLGSRREPTAS